MYFQDALHLEYTCTGRPAPQFFVDLNELGHLVNIVESSQKPVGINDKLTEARIVLGWNKWTSVEERKGANGKTIIVNCSNGENIDSIATVLNVTCKNSIYFGLTRSRCKLAYCRTRSCKPPGVA